MNKLSILFLIIAATVVASCNYSSTKVLVVAVANASERYSCPMKCQGDTAYTTGGNCPVCEMELVKE